MTLTAEQSSNKERYEAAKSSEIIDIIRVAMGEGCIRPCHVYDAVDELICRVQAFESKPKRNIDRFKDRAEAFSWFRDNELWKYNRQLSAEYWFSEWLFNVVE